jgi:hypothetical protein
VTVTSAITPAMRASTFVDFSGSRVDGRITATAKYGPRRARLAVVGEGRRPGH